LLFQHHKSNTKIAKAKAFGLNKCVILNLIQDPFEKEWIADPVHNDGFLVFGLWFMVTYRHPELDSGSI